MVFALKVLTDKFRVLFEKNPEKYTDIQKESSGKISLYAKLFAVIALVLILSFLLPSLKNSHLDSCSNGNSCINHPDQLSTSQISFLSSRYEKKLVYSHDLTGDRRDEVFLVTGNLKNSRMLIVSQNRRWNNFCPQMIVLGRGIPVSIESKDLEGNGRSLLIVHLSSAGSGGFGSSHIIWYDENTDKFRETHTRDISYYPVEFLESNTPNQTTILARELADNSSSSVDNTYVHKVYHFRNGDFHEASSSYSDYYLEVISDFKEQMTSSEEKSETAQYIYGRTRGIIRAMKLGGFREAHLDPAETLKEYYKHIKTNDPALAFIYLTRAMQEKKSWKNFRKTVDSDAHSVPEIKSTDIINILDDTVKIDVVIKCPLQNGKDRKNNKICYTLVVEDEIWKIDGIEASQE
jgi:hypothetical protein